MNWRTTYQGSVNRWECDENEHLNVRFYLEKATEAVESYVSSIGFGVPRIVHAHFKFLREARIAAPISGRCSIVESTNGSLVLQCHLEHTHEGHVFAAMHFHVEISETRQTPPLVALTEQARPRGLRNHAPPSLPETLQEAERLGFRRIGAGVTRPLECDSLGRMAPAGYLGRVSDSIPNLGLGDSSPDSDMRVGGAVLEYRMHEERPLLCADRFEIASALIQLGEKTYRLLHLIFRAEKELCLTAEAIGVSLDLDTRRAVPPPPAKRSKLESMLITGFE
jgi:acyl-CoA thioester hydrolase